MQDQPKYRPQRPSEFFADGRSERQPVEGTIARGALDEDTAFYEGKDAAGKDIEAFPIAVDKAVIVRGQQRFDIYCAPCHGRIGNGLGMIVRRGFKQPPSYHIDRLRERAGGPFLRRDLQRIWRHAELRGAGCSRATAGRLWPTSGRCNTAKTPISTICRRRRAPACRPAGAAPIGGAGE